MSAGGRLDFDSLDWADDQPDIHSRAEHARGQRWAIVEYEFDDGTTPSLHLGAGQGFYLMAGTGHRGRNPGGSSARLFLIDDPA